MITERKRSMIERLDAMAPGDQLNFKEDDKPGTVRVTMTRLKALTGKEFVSRTFPDKSVNVWRTK